MRPYILIDVDGVLNPFPPKNEKIVKATVNGLTYRLNLGTRGRVRQAAQWTPRRGAERIGGPMSAPSNYQGKATIKVTLDTGYEYTLEPVPYHGDTPEEAAKRAIAFAGRIMLKDEVTH